ncbi:MAG: hypothetical protein LC778_14400 [Acidobacteria bacterium]|nr:hypothetical protein [Acidobacteriota bacterium]
MIKLMFFAPCEKIIEAKDNTSSLISVLEHVLVKIETNEKPPEKAGLPLAWSVIVLWHRDTDISEPVELETRIELVTPKGEAVMGVVHPFVVSNNFFNFRNTVQFPIFPIGMEGVFNLTLDYRKQGTQVWERAAEYPIRVLYQMENVLDENKNGKGVEETPSLQRISDVQETSKKTHNSSEKRHSKSK